MSVEDWAREQAEKWRPGFEDSVHDRDYWEGDAFQGGIVRAFDALLSDEANDAARREADRHSRNAITATMSFVECSCGLVYPATQEGWCDFYDHGPRAALQAAVDAVTKGDTE